MHINEALVSLIINIIIVIFFMIVLYIYLCPVKLSFLTSAVAYIQMHSNIIVSLKETLGTLISLEM